MNSFYFNSFDDFINEGRIQVYEPGNPYRPESSMTWRPGIYDHLDGYAKDGTGVILGCDFDYDKYIAEEGYRSVPLGTWKDKSLPLFLDKHPRYSEVEFDYVSLIPDPEKDPKEPWVEVTDRNDVRFMIPPYCINDIYKGGSRKLGILPGELFLIDGMRGRIDNFKNDTVYIRLQNGDKKKFSVEEWKSKKYMSLDSGR